ncbi:MAG: hypothetical protein ACE14S_09905 [Candidatus Bathyarchaeia archaeon]
MQRERKPPREPAGLAEEAARRTTIILDKEERDYIDQLIREGKEPGIKPLISKMLNIYRNVMVCDWQFPGEYYCGLSRIAFLNVELLNILIHQIPREKWHEVGRAMGAALKVSMETRSDLQIAKADNWKTVFERLKVQGFGEILLKDKYLLTRMPFITESEVLAGMLEGLLSVELTTKSSVPPIIFEIKKRTDASLV